MNRQEMLEQVERVKKADLEAFRILARALNVKVLCLPMYCTLCDAEALYLTEKGAPLCASCVEAYSWGQASPDAQLTPLDKYPEQCKLMLGIEEEE